MNTVKRFERRLNALINKEASAPMDDRITLGELKEGLGSRLRPTLADREGNLAARTRSSRAAADHSLTGTDARAAP